MDHNNIGPTYIGETARNLEVRVQHIQAKNVYSFYRADDSVAKLSFEIFSVGSGNVAIDKDARLTY